MQKINTKKMTKEQMAKLLEEAQANQQAAEKAREEALAALSAKASELSRQGAELDALRNKLKDTEAALGRANAEVSRQAKEIKRVYIACYDYGQRANYAEAHPWRNLWAWVKRKLGCKA